MTAPRTAAVPLEGGGQLVIPCPPWCEGHDGPAMHPSDVAHSSPEALVTVTVADGREVELLALALEYAPFSTASTREPYATVHVGGDYHRFDVAGLYALAEQIAERAPTALRALADRLAQVLEDGGPS